jgi:WD40 repeat protein
MLVIWDTRTGQQTHLLTAAMLNDRVMTIAWSADGLHLAAGLYTGQIAVWDMTTFTPLALLQGHAGVVSALAWSPDGGALASTSPDGTVLVWKIAQ